MEVYLQTIVLSCLIFPCLWWFNIEELFSGLESDSKEQQVITELFYKSATYLHELAFQLAEDLRSNLISDSKEK